MNQLWKLLVLAAVLNFGTCRNVLKPNGRTIQYQTKPSQEIKIKLKIHFDPTLTARILASSRKNSNSTKTKTKLKLLSQNLLLEVENMFKHKSLDQNITFELIDTKILKKGTRVAAIVDENASKYLKSYCLWQSQKKTDQSQLYYSVLFTGLDLYYLNQGKKVRRSTGRGYMSGMCLFRSSCTLIEWKEANAGYLLAHEIGHSLGMSHDGAPFNTCSPRGFIMEEKYDAIKPSTAWSSCSREALKKYLTSRKSSCLKTNISKRIGR